MNYIRKQSYHQQKWIIFNKSSQKCDLLKKNAGINYSIIYTVVEYRHKAAIFQFLSPFGKKYLASIQLPA